MNDKESDQQVSADIEGGPDDARPETAGEQSAALTKIERRAEAAALARATAEADLIAAARLRAEADIAVLQSTRALEREELRKAGLADALARANEERNRLLRIQADAELERLSREREAIAAARDRILADRKLAKAARARVRAHRDVVASAEARAAAEQREADALKEQAASESRAADAAAERAKIVEMGALTADANRANEERLLAALRLGGEATRSIQEFDIENRYQGRVIFQGSTALLYDRQNLYQGKIALIGNSAVYFDRNNRQVRRTVDSLPGKRPAPESTSS